MGRILRNRGSVVLFRRREVGVLGMRPSEVDRISEGDAAVGMPKGKTESDTCDLTLDRELHSVLKVLKGLLNASTTVRDDAGHGVTDAPGGLT